MGQLLQAKGKLAEAEPYYRDALEKRRRILGEQHQSTLISIRDMGSLWIDEGKPGAAAALLAPAEAAMRKEFTGENAYWLAKYLLSLGMARSALGQYADAEANLIEARSILASSPYPKEPRDCSRALADLYTAWNRVEPGKGYDAKSTEWARQAQLLPITPKQEQAKLN
jgi:tetratricopeptide (TPR) repeat protein